MRFLPPGTRMGRRALFLAFFLLLLVTARVSADTTAEDDAPTAAADRVTDAKPTEATAGPTTANDATATRAGTTDPPSTTIDSTTDSDPTTTESTESDSSTTSTMETTTTDTTSTTTSSTSSSTTDSTTSTTSSATSTSDPLIPVVTVPPTADAPYMQKSSTPEGTLFIAVGAALGVIGLSVLAWRALVAWSVNRSVKRAAAIHSSETKGLLRTRRKKRRTVYSRGGHTSNMSLDRLGKSTRHSHRPSKVPSSNSGLFYSPTAGAGMHGSGNRGSNYLPAGYYAAGSAVAGGGQSAPYIPSSLSGLGPQAQGYTRTRSGPSPPSTPVLPSSSVHDVSYNSRQSLANPSTSSLNLASPSQPRAPSAYLEDLFESHAPPSDLSHR